MSFLSPHGAVHRARARVPTVVVLAALTLGTTACERGCLSAWLADRSGSPGVGGEGPRGSAGRDAAASSFDLGGTDCSDGLARCNGGRVETSLAGHVPYPCASPREKGGRCECPWQSAGTCEAGCVTDGIEVVAGAEVARVQLCSSAEPLLRPLLPSESAAVEICADERASCVAGIVRVCAARGQPVRLIAGCVNGCAAGIDVDPGDVLTRDGLAAILCRRAHAERR